MTKKELKLLGTWSSPYSLRVVLALKLKGLEYDYSEEDLSNKSPLLLEYNPVYKKIPVLVHNGKPIAESLVILEYMDETWKHNPLFPSDPYERAMARFWVIFIDDKLLDSVWRAFIKREEKEEEEYLSTSMECLKILEQELEGKRFFGGGAINIVDIFLGSIVNLINMSYKITGLKLIDGDKFPILFAWAESFFRSQVIVDSLPPEDKLVFKYKGLLEKYSSSN